MMMDSEMMRHMVGGDSTFIPFLAWITYILFIVLIVMAIIALAKYLKK